MLVLLERHVVERDDGGRRRTEGVDQADGEVDGFRGRLLSRDDAAFCKNLNAVERDAGAAGGRGPHDIEQDVDESSVGWWSGQVVDDHVLAQQDHLAVAEAGGFVGHLAGYLGAHRGRCASQVASSPVIGVIDSALTDAA